MNTTRRSFVCSLPALTIFAHGAASNVPAAPAGPELEPIFRNGARVRMADLRKGDVFTLRGSRFVAVSDPDPSGGSFIRAARIGISAPLRTWPEWGRTS